MSAAVMERERVADACQYFEGCPGEVMWTYRPNPVQRTYPVCDDCKQEQERVYPGRGEFVRIAEARS